jgi:hypothetical protein
MPEDEWTLIDEAVSIVGERRIQRAWRDPSFPFRGVPHAIPRTREPIEISFADRRGLVLDCDRKLAGRPRLWDYQLVEMRTVDVEGLALEAKPPTPQSSRDGKTADAFAASPAAEDAPVTDEQPPQSGPTSETLLPKILQTPRVRKAADALLKQWSERPASNVGEMQTFVLTKSKQASKTTVERAIRRLEMLGRWSK